MLYSLAGGKPQELPFRIRLANGQTRTEPSTFTTEEITSAGYVPVPEFPTITKFQKAEWKNNTWFITDLDREKVLEEERQLLLHDINIARKNLIEQVEWRIFRHQSELRLGITPTEADVSHIDRYIQALRDITNQPDLSNITWPQLVE
ncbi:MAG: hypothetical protein EBZ53_03780 [Verrucomicrobia bacterium]|nr:hypothetical protein [Verrucomicrobiota bacterium]NDA25785.1 hypothetical protein [Verrucomicrobiota bacterium]NDD81677.1 hypothetical protein [Verrucomicrobiota bacterium]